MYTALLAKRHTLVAEFESKAARYKEILIKEMVCVCVWAYSVCVCGRIVSGRVCHDVSAHSANHGDSP